MNELWIDITDYEGYYQISNLGNVRRIVKNGYKNVKPRNEQYATVSLSKKCDRKTVAIHRLVALHFIPNPRGCTEVNHINGNKRDNRAINLEWCTPKENTYHAMEKLNKYPFGKKPRKVKQIDKDTNKIIQEFRSVSDASRSIGIPSARACITSCCSGMTTSAYGYKWEYAD